MKTQTMYNFSRLLWLYIPLTIATSFTSQQASAQKRDLFFGFETTSGDRKYNVHSDLPNWKGASVIQHGQTYGIIFGSSLITSKFRIGNFASGNGDRTPIHSSSMELAFNISPLQLISKQDRVIEPYLVSSVETTRVYSSGTFTPLDLSPKATGSTCSCTCDSTSTGSTGLPPTRTTTPTKADPQPYSGNFGTTRVNVGVGVNVHLSKGYLFLNLFAEMKYGIAAGTTASTQALLYTYALNQKVYSVGAAIGISKNRSHGRLRRNRFR